MEWPRRLSTRRGCWSSRGRVHGAVIRCPSIRRRGNVYHTDTWFVTATQLHIDTPGDRPGDTPEEYIGDTRGYRLALATGASEVRAAQRLRSAVLAAENPFGAMGLGPRDDGSSQHADDRSDHLIVWYCGDVRSPARVGERRTAVATVRLFPPHSNDAAPRGAGLEAGRRFGLMPLEGILDSTVEVGPACVEADHRTGAPAAMLWAGVAKYLQLTGYRYAIGCTPVDLRDGGGAAAACWDLARQRHLAPAQRRCRARVPLPIGGLERADNPVIPPVLPGVLRCGAVLCGPPAWNENSCTAEFLVLLDMHAADRRYLRRFLGSGG
jgi:putative hemolysin